MPSRTISLKELLEAYEEGEFDFPTLVRLVVQRFLEVGPQRDNPEHEGYSEHRKAEHYPDPDNGAWISMAVTARVLTYQQSLQLFAAIDKALRQDQPEEPFLL